MKKHLAPAIILFLITLLFTFPLILHTNNYIPGFFSTDEPYGTIWNFWLMKYASDSGISSQTTNMIAYPFGVKLFSGLLVPYPWLGLNYLLAVLTNAVLAYNIQILMNFFLSAVFTYLLVFFLSKSRLAGIISAIIFSFCPQHFTRSWQHLSLTYFQWLPLVLLSALMLYKDRRLRNGIFFAISLLLLFSFDFTIAYLGLLTLFTLFFYLFFVNWRRGTLKEAKIAGYFKKASWGVVILAVLLIRQILIIWAKYGTQSASAYNPTHRPFEDLFAQSAKPLGFLLPASTHPVFGRFSEQFIGSSLYGQSFTEHTLYLGWLALALALFAFRRRKENLYIGFFIFLAVVAWLFSQPPWWNFFGLKIYMPSFFMYKILPMFRAYCRFGILLMLAIAVLAGFGLKSILERFESYKPKIALTILACGLILFEFWNWPPYKVIDLSRVPAVYYWLKEEPGNPVLAEYPMDIIGPNEMYKFYQTVHHKRIINGTFPGTPAHKIAMTITKLSQPGTVNILKQMGVKYAIVHEEGYLKGESIDDKEELDKIRKDPALKLVRTFVAQECPQKDIMCTQNSGPVEVYKINEK
ncbi:MAG: hypothetical protein PHQ57_04890 [Candidatus Omnitrophica bacterium]|nr:hypothetical protein [Candidatus Omnitrophota bacterium]